MGGGNAQKSAAARLKNMKEAGKTPQERKEASAKAAKDASAFVCKICRTSFMVNVQPPTLYLHVTSKHPTITDPVECFDTMAGYDPSDPKGLKKVSCTPVKGPLKPKKKKKEPEEDLLSVGLKKGKGKGKKKK